MSPDITRIMDEFSSHMFPVEEMASEIAVLREQLGVVKAAGVTAVTLRKVLLAEAHRIVAGREALHLTQEERMAIVAFMKRESE